MRTFTAESDERKVEKQASQAGLGACLARGTLCTATDRLLREEPFRVWHGHCSVDLLAHGVS